MKLLVNNIATLAGIDGGGVLKKSGAEMAQFDAIDQAWMLVEDGIITEFDTEKDRPAPAEVDSVVDAHGGMVLPCWCDSHTHIVYAGSREREFVDKINGLSYAEIARRGGGILNSADRLHELPEQQLYEQAMERVREVISKGTGAIEIKSGYGLNTQDELKMLRVIARIQESTPLRVVSTFLGAHAVSRAYVGRQSEYVDLIVDEMLPAVAAEGLANYVDVFCDQGFFTPEETARILEAGAKYGMRGKIHGQELAPSGGVEVAVRHHALSVDHLESMTDEDIALLRDTDTIPTALPGTSFFLNMPFAPARKMIAAGLPMAIASDYNPGSTPSGDMKFVVSLACIKMRLQPAEAFNAATINGAAAMGLSGEYGSIAPGKVANFFITRPISSIDFIPYAYTTPIIDRVFLVGQEQ
ncbi:MAG: imidazolonepropionase [Muribaculaceae bacterium]|nr:imidazolonepropionase [Muribaculaceae bacterium]MBR3102086.1 imidazolonepropionase [Muribaculaceae bacterium]